MDDAVHHVRPQFRSKMDVSAALVAGWARVMMRTRRGKFADDMGVDTKTLRRWMTGEHSPEFHTALNSMVIDITALNEVFDLYGLEVRPKVTNPGNDMVLLADTCHLSAQLAEVMADGVRDHRETLELADTLTPLIPVYQAIVRQAADIRAGVR